MDYKLEIPCFIFLLWSFHLVGFVWAFFLFLCRGIGTIEEQHHALCDRQSCLRASPKLLKLEFRQLTGVKTLIQNTVRLGSRSHSNRNLHLSLLTARSWDFLRRTNELTRSLSCCGRQALSASSTHRHWLLLRRPGCSLCAAWQPSALGTLLPLYKYQSVSDSITLHFKFDWPAETVHIPKFVWL